MKEITVQSIVEEFDRTFGTTEYDEDGEPLGSIGRSAGCDDCRISMEYRDEQKALLVAQLTTLLDTLAERVEEVAGDCSKEGDICDFCDGHPPCEYRMGRQRATEKVLSIIKSLSVK